MMLRLSPEELERIQRRISDNVQRGIDRKPRTKRNKYGAEPIEYQGIKFDSKAEARRYMMLQAMESAGEITGLRTQVSFDLIPAQSIGGRKERPVRYVADFTYNMPNGALIVEDVKSGPTKTREFIIKRKLMAFIHGIEVIEVMACA